MNCPIDGTELRMTERQGVEIDYCPQCRGVWLDRGELDKVIERSGMPPDREEARTSRDEYERSGETDRGGHHGGQRRGKRRSRLEDLFDFG